MDMSLSKSSGVGDGQGSQCAVKLWGLKELEAQVSDWSKSEGYLNQIFLIQNAILNQLFLIQIRFKTMELSLAPIPLSLLSPIQAIPRSSDFFSSSLNLIHSSSLGSPSVSNYFSIAWMISQCIHIHVTTSCIFTTSFICSESQVIFSQQICSSQSSSLVLAPS